MMTWLVLGFVLYMNGDAEFFTSANIYSAFGSCDEFSRSWAKEKGGDANVKEVWSQCVDIGDVVRQSSI